MGKKSEKQLEACRKGGNARYAQLGPEGMAEMGRAGYEATASKYGYEYTNRKIFGSHLKLHSFTERLHKRSQPRLYLPGNDNEQK